MIDWAAAHACVGAAVKAAGVLGLRVNVAVVDAGGVLAAFLRMPGAQIAATSSYYLSIFHFHILMHKYPSIPCQSVFLQGVADGVIIC